VPAFEILDTVDTPFGLLLLRRRALPGRPGERVTEVTIDGALLMSSRDNASERALAERALQWHGAQGGEDRTALVGGLGLGYTAAALLDGPRVGTVRVIERVPAVLGWVRDGLVPLADRLRGDARLALEEGDIYARLLAPPPPSGTRYDLVLIDVDHTPSERLDDSSAPFYTAEGQRRVAQHLAPGGVLAVWSAGDDDAFAAVLAEVHAESRRERVHWVDNAAGHGEEMEDVLFLAHSP